MVITSQLYGKDILGDFFEGIIREGFKQTKGQFFTHINVVRFLLWGLQLDKLALDRVNNDLEIPYLIDPSAGSGTFLIEYMKFITKNLKYRFKDKLDDTRDIEDKFHQWFMPDHRENKWAKDYIYGSEINFNLGTATKVNMILHGDGSTNILLHTYGYFGCSGSVIYNEDKEIVGILWGIDSGRGIPVESMIWVSPIQHLNLNAALRGICYTLQHEPRACR